MSYVIKLIKNIFSFQSLSWNVLYQATVSSETAFTDCKFSFELFLRSKFFIQNYWVKTTASFWRRYFHIIEYLGIFDDWYFTKKIINQRIRKPNLKAVIKFNGSFGNIKIHLIIATNLEILTPWNYVGCSATFECDFT